MNPSLRSVVVVAPLLASSAAMSSAVTVDQSFDLTLPDPGPGLRLSTDVFVPSVSIVEGDTVTLNFGFTGNQALRLSSLGGTQRFEIGLFQNDSSNTSFFAIDSLSLQLLGSGTGLFVGLEQGSGSDYIGAVFDDAYLAGGTDATLTGLRVSFHVAHLGDGVSAYDYDAAYLNFNADGIEVTAAPASVPEPVTPALVALGLAAVGLSRRAGGAGACA